MKIYKITNVLTNLSFIGVTELDPIEYYNNRFDDSIRYKSKFLDMIKHTLFEDLEFKLLDDLNPDEAWAKQIYYIFHYNTYNSGYQSNYGSKLYGEGWKPKKIKPVKKKKDKEIKVIKPVIYGKYKLPKHKVYKIYNIVTEQHGKVTLTEYNTCISRLPYTSIDVRKLLNGEISQLGNWILL